MKVYRLASFLLLVAVFVLGDVIYRLAGELGHSRLENHNWRVAAAEIGHAIPEFVLQPATAEEMTPRDLSQMADFVYHVDKDAQFYSIRNSQWEKEVSPFYVAAGVHHVKMSPGDHGGYSDQVIADTFRAFPLEPRELGSVIADTCRFGLSPAR